MNQEWKNRFTEIPSKMDGNSGQGSPLQAEVQTTWCKKKLKKITEKFDRLSRFR